MKYEKELRTILEIAPKASEIIMKYHDGNLQEEIKGDGTPVTIADKKSNELIIGELKLAFPFDGIVSEEDKKVDGDRTWYVDPIDGTKGFIRSSQGGEGDFAIHIGFVEKETLVLGLVYRPKDKVYFYGIKGVGAYKVTGNKIEELKMTQSSPELTVIASYNKNERPIALESIKRLNPSKVLTSGSEGLRLMHLVENKADIRFVERKNMCGTWDVCAPQAIVEAAGGVVKYLSGNEIKYFGQRHLEDFYIAARTQEHFDYAKKNLEQFLRQSA